MHDTIEGFRLSPQQERLWLLQQNSDAYHAHCAILLEGALNVDALEDAVRKAISRNEIYRTSLHRMPGLKIPIQVIGEESLFTWRHINLSSYNPQEQEVKLEELSQEEKHRPIDVEHGPLLHFSFVTLSEQKHVLLVHLLSLHADKRTLENLVCEIARFYSADLASDDLSDEAVQYIQFSEWQRALLEEEDGRIGREYWRKKDISMLSTWSLPFEIKSDKEGIFAPELLAWPIGDAMRTKIEVLTQKYDITTSVFLLTCWKVLLWRLTGREEILVGMCVDGRIYEELAETAGPLAKYLPVSCHLTENQDFSEILAQVKRATDEAFTWQQYFTWEDREEAKEIAAESVFFPFSFDFSQQQANYFVEGLSFSLHKCSTYLEPFKVKVSVLQKDNALVIEFHYNTSLFCVKDIQRLAEQFNQLLKSAVNQPKTLISMLEILSDSEREQILIEFNDTDAEYPEDKSVHQLFEAQVQRTPEAVAVVFEDEHLTYQELNRRANQLAQHLQTLGVGPEVLVGICMERSVELLIGIFGILKADGAYVPLAPTYPKERLAFMVADAQAPVVLTRQYRPDGIPNTVLVVSLESDWSVIAQQSGEKPPGRTIVTNLAYVIYTSGSTGQPKGVMISHQGLVNYLIWCCRYYAVAAGSGSVVHSSPAFDLTITSLFASLLVGCRVVLVPEDQGIEALGRALRQGNNFSLVKITPAHLDVLNQYLPVQELAATTRALIIGGEALFAESLKPWRAHAPQTRLINEYGPTETVVGCCIYEVVGGESMLGSVPIGRPVANTQLYVLDGRMLPVPLGVVGELYIGGRGVARGYLSRADLTAERFMANPFSVEGGARFYRTGDLVRYQAHGRLEYVGRVDHQVKLRGYRIELGEIEVVLGQHPVVHESVVVLREDAVGEKRLVAYVVCKAGVSAPASELRGYMQEKLPEYMVPWRVAWLEALPLTPNGKVDRRALPEPGTTENEGSEDMIASLTPIEEMVVGIWSNILGLEHVSIHDNFFEVGGHSILATQLILRIQSMLKVDMSVRSLFEAPILAELAKQVERALLSKQGVEVPPLVSASREQDLPLSFAQQRLWFLDQLEPGSTAYIIPIVRRMRGTLDVKALERSLGELVRRHENFRTIFRTKDGQPVQVIGPARGLLMPLAELSGLTPEQRETEAGRLIRQEVRRSFDLANGPLLRTTLLRLHEDEHVLLLSMHHIISDGWSLGVFVRELTVLYNAFVMGKPSPLPELPIQYADFAYWQRQWMQGEVLDAQVRYWTQQLRGVAPLDLPTDYPRPAVQTFHGAHQGLLLPAALSDDLKPLSQGEGVTLFMTLLAAFQVLLARYTGQDDIVIGTDIANRTRAEIEGLIGFFVNALVLRTDLSGNPTFQELLGKVREVALGGYTHQDVPFEKLVEVLQPERDLSRSPLFQVAFLLHHVSRSNEIPEMLHGLTLGTFPQEGSTAKFDLTLAMVDTEQGLYCDVEYNTDLFKASTIIRLLGNWQTLLEAIVRDPTQRLADLPLLTANERHQLLVEWNAIQAAYPLEYPLHTRFPEQAARTPDAIALVCADTPDLLLTYREMERRANQLAHHLRLLGVGPEVLVGVYLDRSLELVIAILAIFKAGGVYLPLDPAYPAARLALILADAQPPVLVTQSRWLPSVSEYTTALVCLEPGWQAFSAYSDAPPTETSSMHNLAYVIYTSGSTGRPKGVMVTHEGMLNHLYAKIEALQLVERDIMAQTASHCFDISVWQCLAVLLVGGQVQIICDDDAHDPQRLLKQVGARGVTVLEMVPSLLRLLLEEQERMGADATQSLCLRWLIVTGEAFTAELCRRWWQRNEQIRLMNAYGPTECSDDVTHALLDRLSTSAGANVPIGRAIGNTQLYILDGNLWPVPVGVTGHVYVGGRGVGRGYLHDPGRTAEVFVPDPFGAHEGGRLYQTGDVGRYLADGQIEFLGRSDQQVKVRGYRIEVGEIETLLEEHPMVRQSVVIAQEDVLGNKRLLAYVVLEQAPESSVSALRAYLQGRLPDYMLPSHWEVLESLPLTPNGKVDRRALPAPGTDLPERGADMLSARTPIEEMVATSWGEVLGLTQVNIQANFFEQGGHSLLATQLISRIRAVMQVEVPLRSLFEAPTVAGLAQRVEQALRSEQEVVAPPLLPVVRTQELPLSFAQQRLWFLDQLEPGGVAYNMPLPVRLNGALDITALEHSMQELVWRHESLRTTFRMVEGQLVQVIRAAREFRVPLVDLSELAPYQRETVAGRLVQQEVGSSFDLARGPLLRTALLRLREDEHVLLLNMHHIVSDGWSMDVFVRELTVLYNAFMAGQPSPLPELPIQYADFAVWQRQWLQGEVLDAQVRYWIQHLRGVAPLDLPLDRPRPALQTFRGMHQGLLLPVGLSEDLKGLSQRAGVTLFMTLLAAFQALLLRYTRQTDISVGTPIANRTRAEIEGLIGFFVNTLVLRSDLSGNPTFQELLGRVREVALGAYAHQDVPFEKLVEVLQPERDLSRSPLFQVMFQLQHVSQSTESETLQGLALSGLPQENATAKFDLTLSIVDAGRGLRCEVQYNTDLFEASTITRLLGHWQTLLTGLAAHPEQRLAELPLLTPAERQQLLVEWNNTGVNSPKDTCIHALFAQQVFRTPDTIAIREEDHHLSYAELDQRANQLARHLQRLGVGPEVLVGLCLKRSLGLVIGLLGILKAGGAYVPLDPGYPTERLRLLVGEAQMPVVLTTSRRELVGELPVMVQVMCLDTVWPSIAQQSGEQPSSGVSESNVAYVIYTSGSTGTPKGVMVSHQGLVNYVRWCSQHYTVAAGNGSAVHSSIAFDLTVTSLFAPLVVGRPVVLVPEEQGIEGLAQVVRQGNEFSLLKITPAHLDVLSQALPAQELAATARALIIGGEALLGESLTMWREHAPAIRLINEYGPTETVVGCCIYEVPGEGSVFGPIPIGRPIANTYLYLLDRHLQPVPVGVPGELYIGGSGLARGYVNRPDLTAERFIANPFSMEAGARLYQSGDMARYRGDGTIEYLGRIDQQVKFRGYRIEPGEIEAVLGQHPAVHESVVVAREDTPGDKRLVAYVVARQLPAPTSGELRSFVAEQLPEYMVPSAFVLLHTLPLTSNGKVDRRQLTTPNGKVDQLVLPVIDQSVEPIIDVQPRDELEFQLLQIWEEVLNVRPISVLDNFFELGGHSILAVRLVSRIHKQFGQDLALAILFQNPTLADLAVVLRRQASPESQSALVKIQPNGSKPPFFSVHPVGGNVFCYLHLARYLGPDQPFYGLQNPGLAGTGEYFSKLEAMAAHYIAAMQTVQPQGPYLLGGWSMGGVVAFEMAQQLQKQGYEVALLAIIDSEPPISYLNPNARVEKPALDDAALAESVLRELNLVPGEDFYLREPEEQLKYALERAKDVNVIPMDTDLGLLRRLMVIRVMNNYVTHLYLPSVYPHRITFFRASESVKAAQDLAHPDEAFTGAYGWENLTTGGIEVHIVPGKHSNLGEEPNVQALAASLSHCIDRVGACRAPNI